MLPQKFDLDQYKRILLRRKWYVIIPFFITLLATAVHILMTPRLYRASTLILVQRQTVPKNYVSSTVTSSLSDRIATIKEQVTSRSNLERLVNKYDLYSSKDPSNKGLTMQEKVGLMRRNTAVRVHRGAAFNITFVHTDAEKVMQVANDLTVNFIDENLRVREEQSVGTTRFLQSELDRIEANLKRREATLTAYKQKHMGGLPSELQTNVSMLGRLSEKIVSIERSLDQSRTQKIMIQGQIANLKNMSEALPADLGAPTGISEEGLVSPEIEDLRQRLKALRFRYTENHPDVVKLKKLVAKIEEDQPQTTEPVSEDGTASEDGGPSTGDDIFAVQLESLSFQMDALKQTILELKREKAKSQKKMALLTTRIEETPKRQLELISLQRDYDAIRRQYDSLLTKRLQSQLAENMEFRQKGEQFKVVDQAKLPERPFRPNVSRLLFVGLFAGLAAGFGLALGIEFLDQSFWDYREISEFLQVPLFAVIPRLETEADVRKRQRVRALAYCLSGCLLVAVGIGVYLWMNGNLQEWVKMLAQRS